ncbi:ribonuclease Y [Patescibacteria group bacterium]|uniref:Ribonuclease Y n=1 Tax=candidate division WWE3 bacterium TaxID=2053526 RepID=A0A928Y6I1_UNCKA|nr:ribonuclease Y [candidate division WWE3 bacterium]MCL4733198.1 ribonuclease Y [Patescibacteria group bacterium]MDL1953361.1 ribonuclease Y [Candidatus Uhrbacteria bacterium UHB]RIL00791.1 MAG: ribonuclease Y [Candidatus Uhrbacteria bacterium]
MSYVFLAIAGGAIGLAIGWLVRDNKGKSDINSAEAKAEKIIKEAESKEQDVLLRAKDKAVKILEEARLEEKKALEEMKRQRDELFERENTFSQKLIEIDEQKTRVEESRKKAEEELQRLEELKLEETKKLEEVAGLTEAEAMERILKLVEDRNRDAVLSRMRKLDEQSQEEIDRKAKNILAVAVQRQAASHVQETTTSHLELPSDEMKGRIIGREGRNIKAIENLTGCELVVDETPGMITISGFSPIRRQVAKRALEKLIEDGRIHPGRIEEAVMEAKRELALDMKKAGEDALYEMGISVADVDPKLVQILGRMKYRTSFGQNALLHSLEVAKLSVAIGEQLGADMHVCRVGGLFHDIGKAVDHDLQGGHPELGYQILKKFGYPEEIYYQSIGHHEDKPKTLEAVIIKAADAISGARPGARKDSFELYVKRLEQLEETVQSFPGIEKVYAIQAGREVRVFVNPSEVDDLEAEKLARDIASKLEQELKYPGEIRVTLIREKRVTEFAR